MKNRRAVRECLPLSHCILLRRYVTPVPCASVPKLSLSPGVDRQLELELANSLLYLPKRSPPLRSSQDLGGRSERSQIEILSLKTFRGDGIDQQEKGLQLQNAGGEGAEKVYQTVETGAGFSVQSFLGSNIAGLIV